MKESIKTIERKVASVRKIAKITKAMKIIATMRFKSALSEIKDASKFVPVTEEIFAKLQCLLSDEELNLPLQLPQQIKDKLWLIFVSDLGLCGAYNNNLFKKISQNSTNKDLFVIVGKKAATHFQYLGFQLTKQYEITNFTQTSLDQLVSWISKHFQVLFKTIVVVYTEFVSPSNQKVVFKQLLPIETQTITKPQTIIGDFLIEPSARAVYQNTLSLYLKSYLLTYYWNAKASEEKTRQIAMESASDNAQEMVDELKLQYNQLRQEKITKEIILVSQDT